jgi:hypothetical protein
MTTELQLATCNNGPESAKENRKQEMNKAYKQLKKNKKETVMYRSYQNNKKERK